LARLTGSPVGKPAPRIARYCVPGCIVDKLDLGDNRPLQGQLQGLDEV